MGEGCGWRQAGKRPGAAQRGNLVHEGVLPWKRTSLPGPFPGAAGTWWGAGCNVFVFLLHELHCVLVGFFLIKVINVNTLNSQILLCDWK